DAESPSTLSFGADAVLSVDPAGVLFAYSPSSRQLYRVDAGSDRVSATTDVDLGGRERNLSITSVAGRWAVLDAGDSVLHLAEGAVDLSGVLDGAAGVVLQRPSVTGDEVLVAYTGGLLAVPLGGSAPVSIAAGVTGAAVAPVIVAGC